jgi:hypothetical protein
VDGVRDAGQPAGRHRDVRQVETLESNAQFDDAPMRLTLDQWHVLVAHGIVGTVELLGEKVWIGEYELAWSAEQVAAAAALGIELADDPSAGQARGLHD